MSNPSDIPQPTRDTSPDSASTSVVVAGLVVAVAAWSGLIWLVSRQLPTVPYRWAFYAMLHIALTGMALPFIRLLHRRFSRPDGPHTGPGVMIRQAVWVGVFGTACTWLRIPRLLSVPVALILAMALAVIEILLRLREQTRWRPD
jgi:hypothetical protein